MPDGVRGAGGWGRAVESAVRRATESESAGVAGATI